MAAIASELLGSVRVLGSLVGETIEDQLLRKVAGPQVTFAQLKLLLVLAGRERQKVGEVAKLLGVSDAAASKAADRLVQRKLLRREEASGDRRAVQLLLTWRSRRLLQTLDIAKNRTPASAFAKVSPEAMRAGTEMLDQLSAELLTRKGRPDPVCLRCGIYARKACLLRSLAPKSCLFGPNWRSSVPQAGAPTNGAKEAESP